jgi:cysteine desulfurase/selenocysteine lyase
LPELALTSHGARRSVMPLLARFGTTATCRASFALFNTPEEIDGLAAGLIKAQDFFA